MNIALVKMMALYRVCQNAPYHALGAAGIVSSVLQSYTAFCHAEVGYYYLPLASFMTGGRGDMFDNTVQPRL